MVAGRRGPSDKTQALLFVARADQAGLLISYAIRGGPSKRADYVARAFLIKHEEVGGRE